MICTEKDLKICIEKCLQAQLVAVDTEFVWEKTYYPILGLIQLATPDESFLIDPIALEDLSPLKDLMENESVTKILHDALQDLQIISRATDSLPKNIFDTKTAAGFCGLSSTLSLGSLLEKTVGVVLPKTESRTDWTQRPLTEKQIEYAIDDVVYMEKAFEKLNQLMKENNALDWFDEEMKALENPNHYSDARSANKQFKRISGSSKFKAKQLAVMEELITWRENRAKKRNRPRNFIVDTNVLIDIALKSPKSADELKTMPSVPRFIKERYANDVMDILYKGYKRDPKTYPKVFKPQLDRRTLKNVSNRILTFCREKAEAINIDSQLVTSRKEVESFINKFVETKKEPTSRLNQGWRKEFFADLTPFVKLD